MPVTIVQTQPLLSVELWCLACRYSYNVAANADERRDNPTPAQQKINELLYEKRLQKQFEKP